MAGLSRGDMSALEIASKRFDADAMNLTVRASSVKTGETLNDPGICGDRVHSRVARSNILALGAPPPAGIENIRVAVRMAALEALASHLPNG